MRWTARVVRRPWWVIAAAVVAVVAAFERDGFVALRAAWHW